MKKYVLLGLVMVLVISVNWIAAEGNMGKIEEIMQVITGKLVGKPVEFKGMGGENVTIMGRLGGNIEAVSKGPRGEDILDILKSNASEYIRIVGYNGSVRITGRPWIQSKNDIIIYKKKSEARLTTLFYSNPKKIVPAIVTFDSPVSDQILSEISDYSIGISSVQYISNRGGGGYRWPIPEEERELWKERRIEELMQIEQSMKRGFKKYRDDILKRMEKDNIPSKKINVTIEYMKELESALVDYVDYMKGNKTNPPEIGKIERPISSSIIQGNASIFFDQYLDEIDEKFDQRIREVKANIYNPNEIKMVVGYTVASVSGSAKDLLEVSKNPNVFLVDIGPVEYYREYPDAIITPSSGIYYEYKKYT